MMTTTMRMPLKMYGRPGMSPTTGSSLSTSSGTAKITNAPASVPKIERRPPTTTIAITLSDRNRFQLEG